MLPTEKQIQELREQFVNKLEQMQTGTFHPADIDRVKTDNYYLKRFLLHNDCNQENAFNMLWDTCEWRQKFGANDINEENVNQNILNLGSVFSYGKDKDGKTLLIFKSKKHFKGSFDFEDHKKCLIYWMERLERQGNGEMITLFFDLDGAVLANMDMDYTKYLISLFKNYYPYFLNYIIIFEMAWVLSALFRVIKTWLPPKAVEKMKFVNKSNVKEYIDPEYALKSWGGRDNYIYQFEPEQKISVPLNNGDDSKKKVHFADSSFKQDQLSESGFDDSYASTNALNSSFLNISPIDVMTFLQEGNEMTSSIILKNENSKCISFKIKTNSPEKFRVRPTSGVLPTGATATVNVVLLPGYLVQTLQRDKFLIMSLQIENPDISQQEISDLWKHVNDKDVQQHRLRCSVPQTVAEASSKNSAPSINQSNEELKLASKVSSDITKLLDLKEELRIVKQQLRIIVLGIIFLICSASYYLFNNYMDSYSLKNRCCIESPKQD